MNGKVKDLNIDLIIKFIADKLLAFTFGATSWCNDSLNLD